MLAVRFDEKGGFFLPTRGVKGGIPPGLRDRVPSVGIGGHAPPKFFNLRLKVLKKTIQEIDYKTPI